MTVLPHRLSTVLATFAALGTALSWSPIVAAQPTTQPVSFSQSDRDRMYAELARDVAALDRELSVYKRVVQLVAPSVVHVEATPLASFRLAEDIEEAGSGVVVRIGEQDYVLTNRHVVKHSNPGNIRLELADGRQLRPTRILSDLMEIGDVVMAFGSPFNLRQSVTRGIISGKGRVNLELDGENGEEGVNFQNFLQTDAAINPGNSGGPLANLRGEVIGLNTAIASNSGGNDGIGFSIPINIAVSIMRQLVETGAVEFGFLGVTLDGRFDSRTALSLGLPRLTGARVSQVSPGSPADEAGLRSNDVVVRFNGTPIENDRHLVSLVKLSEIGRELELVIVRGGQFMTVHASIGRSPTGVR